MHATPNCRLPIILAAFFALAGTALAQPATAQKTTANAATTTAAADSTASALGPIPLSLARSIVIGASVSDGFGTQALISMPNPELGKPGAPADAPATIQKLQAVRLTEALAAVVGGTDLPVHRASMMFFNNPQASADKQLVAAVEAATPTDKAKSPGIVFALDYLFWQVYGDVPESERLKTLERGLKRIETLPGPVVIGDFPDMRHATLMLRPFQVPTVETLAKANARLAEWAREQPTVAVVPLSALVLAVRSSSPATIGGTTYTVDQARELMASDGLHATGKGVIALAQECLVQLKAKNLLTPESTWETDPAKALARIKSRTPATTPPQLAMPASAPARELEPVGAK